MSCSPARSERPQTARGQKTALWAYLLGGAGLFGGVVGGGGKGGSDHREIENKSKRAGLVLLCSSPSSNP